MVFFYSCQSIALSMAIYIRLREADIIVEEFKAEVNNHQDDLYEYKREYTFAASFIIKAQFSIQVLCLIIIMILIARGTSREVFFSKRTAQFVTVFGIVDGLIHVISFISIIAIKEPENISGVANGEVLKFHVFMCMVN